jgi:hypothetical protein
MAGTDHAVQSERAPDSDAPRRAAAPEQETGATAAGAAPATGVRTAVPSPGATSLGARQVRAKSVVGAATDPAEREADHAADRALRMAAPEQERPAAVDPTVADATSKGPGAATSIPPEIKRSPAGSAAPTPGPASATQPPMPTSTARPVPAPPSGSASATPIRSQAVTDHDPHGGHAVPTGTERYLDQSQGTGSPLPDGTRRYFETRFSTDFRAVRVHDDAAAGQAAQSIGALAFTRGRDMWFSAGAYDPVTDGGRRLLAHELAHVAQQNPGIGRRADESSSQTAAGPPPGTEAGTRAYAPDNSAGQEPLAHELTHVVQESAGLGDGVSRVRHPDDPAEAQAGRTAQVMTAPGLESANNQVIARALGVQRFAGPSRHRPPVVPDLHRVAGESKALPELRQSAVNAVVGGIVQRQSAPIDIHARISAVLASPDPMEVIRIMDLPEFGQATDAERIGLIRIDNQFGDIDPLRLARLWRSFGDVRVPYAVNAYQADWETSARSSPGMPDLVPAVPETVTAFRATLRSLAEYNLAQNEAFVRQRMEQLGLTPGRAQPFTPDEQRLLRQNLQKIAYNVWVLRQSQQRALHIEIGRTVGRISLPVTFDPAGPHAADVPAAVDEAKWNAIKMQWDGMERPIAEAAATYPEIYELLAQGDDDALLHFSRVMPEDAANPQGSSLSAAQGHGYQSEGKKLLLSLFDRIHKAQEELGSIDLLELPTLYERIYALPGRWNHGFDEWVARRAVRLRTQEERTLSVLTAMGEGAAAIVATFLSGGMALAVGAVGAGIGITKAAVDYAEAGRLETLARSTPLHGTELVTRAQADAKMIEGQAEIFAAVISALAIVGAAWAAALEVRLTTILEKQVADEALRGALLAKVPDKTLLIRLLQKSDTPAELSALLDAGDAARAEHMLDLRTAVRNRVSQLRAGQQPRLDADPALEKELAEAEELLNDANNADGASRKVDDVVDKLAQQDFAEGLNPPVLGVEVESNKFSYILRGEVASDAHNVPRAADNARQMHGIGLYDTEEGRAILRDHLERVPYEPSNIVARNPEKEFKPSKFPKQSVFSGYWGGPTEVRESLLIGPGGGIKLQSTWEVRYGIRRLTTVVPKGPPLEERPPYKPPP